jgi:hypothetical protein
MRNRQFVGRQTTLLHLDRILHETPKDSNHFKLVVLYGTGGVGKTQIALEHAYLSKSKYSAIFWIDGSSKESALLSMLGCLERISTHYASFGATEDNPRYQTIKKALDQAREKEDVPGQPKSDSIGISNWHQDPKAQYLQLLADAFFLWLSSESNRHWLIILDNVDDIESFDFRELLPKTEHGAVVVTSRRSDLAVKWDAIEVTDMDVDEAIDLLMASTKLVLRRETSGMSPAAPGCAMLIDGSTEWAAAQRLVEILGYFPLAIVQAGSFIASRQQVANPIAGYIELFLSHSKMMLSHRNAKAAWDYRDDTILTTWEISYLAVHEQMPRATEILHICAFLNRDSIQEYLFVLGLPSHQTEGSIPLSVCCFCFLFIITHDRILGRLLKKPYTPYH